MAISTKINKSKHWLVEKSRKRLLCHIEQMPRLQFTSGDITSFIAGRTTYAEAWRLIREAGSVRRVGAPRGTATLWRRAKQQ